MITRFKRSLKIPSTISFRRELTDLERKKNPSNENRIATQGSKGGLVICGDEGIAWIPESAVMKY